MYKVVATKKFKKDFKKLAKSGRFDLTLFNKVVNTLANGKTLHEKYKDHLLKEGHERTSEVSSQA